MCVENMTSDIGQGSRSGRTRWAMFWMERSKRTMMTHQVITGRNPSTKGQGPKSKFEPIPKRVQNAPKLTAWS